MVGTISPASLLVGAEDGAAGFARSFSDLALRRGRRTLRKRYVALPPLATRETTQIVNRPLSMANVRKGK